MVLFIGVTLGKKKENQIFHSKPVENQEINHNLCERHYGSLHHEEVGSSFIYTLLTLNNDGTAYSHAGLILEFSGLAQKEIYSNLQTGIVSLSPELRNLCKF